jgi:hypothetical protein
MVRSCGISEGLGMMLILICFLGLIILVAGLAVGLWLRRWFAEKRCKEQRVEWRDTWETWNRKR